MQEQDNTVAASPPKPHPGPAHVKSSMQASPAHTSIHGVRKARRGGPVNANCCRVSTAAAQVHTCSNKSVPLYCVAPNNKLPTHRLQCSPFELRHPQTTRWAPPPAPAHTGPCSAAACAHKCVPAVAARPATCTGTTHTLGLCNRLHHHTGSAWHKSVLLPASHKQAHILGAGACSARNTHRCQTQQHKDDLTLP
jgi:hypothetical protein